MTAAPPQRRWSEVTSQADRGPPEVRRWSIPWKLALPTAPGGDQRSRSTTPGMKHFIFVMLIIYVYMIRICRIIKIFVVLLIILKFFLK